MRHTTMSFTAVPKCGQEVLFASHVGAARFARNQCLRLVIDALEKKRSDPEHKIPWSGFDLINAFNQWKRSEDAGFDTQGNPGLPWRKDVSSGVFEESAVDLGKALKAFSESRKGQRKGRRVGFPRFQKRGFGRDSCRFRNKGHAVRIDASDPQRLYLPKIRWVHLRESTRRLRRLLKRGAKILFVTLRRRAKGWGIAINIQAPDFCESMQKPPIRATLGIDRGLKHFAVTASPSGEHRQRVCSPRPLQHSLRTLRRLSQAVSRKKKGSKNRFKAARRLARSHQRIRAQRQHFLHELSTKVSKSHAAVVIEDLNVAGMMRNRCLSRHIADAGWAEFARQLRYKCAWYGSTLVEADRWYPSTKTCSACQTVKNEMPLAERTYTCVTCGLRIDRDLNAAINLAKYPSVAKKCLETKNGCGGVSSGPETLVSAVKLTSMKQQARGASRQRACV